jgi:phospholipid/cholesterol/gamma-HCH transport system substrate-binding protein
MRKPGLEFKVGIFVVVALALLAGLVIKVGDFYLKPGYTANLIFDTVNGIDTGSPVRLAGVTVGNVKDVRVLRNAEGKTEAQVAAWINAGVYIEEDARPRITSMGFLGEKFIEILPGSNGAKSIGDGGVLTGREHSNMDDVVEAGQRLIGKIDYAIDNVNEVVANPEFKNSAKGTFVNADKAMKNLAEMSDDLKDAAKSARIVLGRLRDGEGSVGKLLKEDKMARDLEAFVADIKAHPWKLLKRN